MRSGVVEAARMKLSISKLSLTLTIILTGIDVLFTLGDNST